MCKPSNITGKRYGIITVESMDDKRDPWGKVIWNCRCDCGNLIQRTKSDLVYKIKSCGCERNKSISKSRWFGYGEISKTYWSSIKKGAEYRNIEFNITMEYAWELYIEQNKKCALSRLPIEFSRNRKKTRSTYSEQSASLDRIDSNYGYITGNVQWVTKQINIAKNEQSNEEFLTMCKTVVNAQGGT